MPATVKRPPMSAAQRVKKLRSEPPRRSVFLTLIGVSSKVKVIVGGTKRSAEASIGSSSAEEGAAMQRGAVPAAEAFLKERLMALADDTVVYCAHEYSEANAAFAETIEPPSSNAALAARIADIRARRRAQEATVPTTIGAEKATNPFLRPAAARAALSNLAEGATDAEAFAEVRRRKDMF